MEVKLQCGDTITIPEGCKAIVKDGSVVFEKEEKEEAKIQDFKDGDILVTVVNGKRHNAFIYKGLDVLGFHLYYAGINADGNLLINDSPNECRWCNQILSHATEEEKKDFFDTLRENGYQWNAEEKRIEKIRWRAKKGYIYHRLNCYLRPESESDTYRTWNQKCHDSYNYFHTEEQTEEAARRVKETLRKYHEEIGE